MFNSTTGGYSLADIAAATQDKDNTGFGGNCAWWIIILFLFIFGNGFGYGNRNPYGSTTREEISYGFDMNGLENGIRGIQNGLCDGFYEINTGLLNGFSNTAMNAMQNTNAITAQLSNIAANNAACCCETQRLIERGLCEVNYNVLTQSNGINTSIATAARDIIENNNNGVRSILDFLTQDKIATLQAENQSLRLSASQQAQNAYLVNELRPCPIPAYLTCSPYASYPFNNYGSCGCGTCA